MARSSSSSFEWAGTVGLWMAAFGIGSAVIHLLGYEFRILSPIHMYGPEIAWLIRGGMVALGAGLCFLARPGSVPDTVDPTAGETLRAPDARASRAPQ